MLWHSACLEARGVRLLEGTVEIIRSVGLESTADEVSSPSAQLGSFFSSFTRPFLQLRCPLVPAFLSLPSYPRPQFAYFFFFPSFLVRRSSKVQLEFCCLEISLLIIFWIKQSTVYLKIGCLAGNSDSLNAYRSSESKCSCYPVCPELPKFSKHSHFSIHCLCSALGLRRMPLGEGSPPSVLLPWLRHILSWTLAIPKHDRMCTQRTRSSCAISSSHTGLFVCSRHLDHSNSTYFDMSLKLVEGFS